MTTELDALSRADLRDQLNHVASMEPLFKNTLFASGYLFEVGQVLLPLYTADTFTPTPTFLGWLVSEFRAEQ